jgi:hypothetical protein
LSFDKSFKNNKQHRTIKTMNQRTNDFTEKRRYPRINTSNVINYILFDDNLEKIAQGKGRTLNLSQKGALLETNKPLLGSHAILIALDLNDNEIEVKSRVVNTRESDKAGIYLSGVEFVGSVNEQLNAIKAFVKTYIYKKYAAKNNNPPKGSVTAAKVFVEQDNTAVITCPWCKKTKDIDVSRFKGQINVRIKCSCGNTSRIQLEYRRHFRKETELQGYYQVIPKDEKPGDSGIMTVVNLSRNGVRLKINNPDHLFDIGDFINIRFNLDDKDRTLVDRDIVVQNINLPYVGGEFRRPSDTDSLIGFYLFK